MDHVHHQHNHHSLVDPPNNIVASPPPSPSSVRPWSLHQGEKCRSPATSKQTSILIVAITALSVVCVALLASLLYGGGVFTNRAQSPAAAAAAAATRRPLLSSYDTSPPDVHPVLVKNAQLLDQDAWLQRVHVLLNERGKIHQIADREDKLDPELMNHPQLQVYDAQGRFVTAGIVDLHSHLGLYAFPGDLRATEDANERTSPITPMVRAIDAFDPQDPAIGQVLEHGGVTTSLVMPGSANVMGGEAVIVKSKRSSSTTGGMVLAHAPRALKMACGENPKNTYGDGRMQMPYTRMGSAWLMRKTFDAARRLMRRQDDFDRNGGSSRHRPHDLELEPLVALLRGGNDKDWTGNAEAAAMVLNVHCYEVEDLEMALRLSDEFGFRIHTFHHAVEAHKLSHLLAQRNISVATFADRWGTKVESFEATVHAPSIMHKAGVNVVIKSDHPITHARNMMHDAAIARFYGLESVTAIQTVTTNPAKAMLLGDRIGRVQPQYDADLVVWDRYPLALGAQPVRVYIDSNLEFSDDKLPMRDNTVQERGTQPELTVSGGGSKQCGSIVTQTDPIVIDGVRHIHLMDNNDAIEKGRVVIEQGIVTCVGTSCAVPDQATVYKLQGDSTESYVVPGFIEASTALGLMEIEQEIIANDGNTYGMESFRSARYGIRMSSATMTAAWRGGVTTAITHPTGSALIDGYGVAFSTSGSFISDSTIKTQTSLAWTIGTDIKNKNNVASSVSGQITELRNRLLKTNQTVSSGEADPRDAFVRLLQKEIPVVARVNQADDISQLLDMQKDFGFNLLIIGGAESHLLKERLASQGVSVILLPIGLQQGKSWNTRRADGMFNAGDLVDAGVNVGIGVSRLFDARNIRWSAGLVSQEGRGRLTFAQALATITRNVADMFHLSEEHGLGRIKVGSVANLVLFDGNPLTFMGKSRLVVHGQRVECNPEQN